jgi:hypothetical protein
MDLVELQGSTEQGFQKPRHLISDVMIIKGGALLRLSCACFIVMHSWSWWYIALFALSPF